MSEPVATGEPRPADRLAATLGLARVMCLGTVGAVALLGIDQALGASAPWRGPIQALGVAPAAPAWTPPGRDADPASFGRGGHPAIRTGFVPGLDQLVPPAGQLVLAPPDGSMSR